MTTHTTERHLELMYLYAARLNALIEEGTITKESLGTNEMCYLSAAKLVELVGEQARELEKLGNDFGPDIPLSSIGGIRHRIVHDYDGINIKLFEEAVFEDIPALPAKLAPILKENGVEIPPSDKPILLNPSQQDNGAVLPEDTNKAARKYEEAGVPILEADIGVRPDLEMPVIPATEERGKDGDPASEVRDALLKGAKNARCKDGNPSMPEGLMITDDEALALEPEELAEKMAAQDAWKAEHQPSAAERLANAEALANDDTNEIDRPGAGSRGPHH